MSDDHADGWMLTCILIARDGSETSLTVPALARRPPNRIRRPSEIGGAAVVDVYVFSEFRGTPQHAVYLYESTVPQSTDELPADGSPPAGPAPSD
ncbi:hypothetical protein [Leifsonia sp. 21MFCrub1.1]|uniref:hypothetical protein n=1 Tax=Leifsonia sp. 21MFCrub1.1 TaxID=1798223 RepID=UPI000B7ED371|nr:hypothetical protein [Leifsonia sp. 21MFCrub1.1]